MTLTLKSFRWLLAIPLYTLGWIFMTIGTILTDLGRRASPTRPSPPPAPEPNLTEGMVVHPSETDPTYKFIPVVEG